MTCVTNYGRELRRTQANERNLVRASRTDQEQLKMLDRLQLRASRERARLKLRIAEAKLEKAEKDRKSASKKTKERKSA